MSLHSHSFSFSFQMDLLFFHERFPQYKDKKISPISPILTIFQSVTLWIAWMSLLQRPVPSTTPDSLNNIHLESPMSRSSMFSLHLYFRK